MEKTISGQNDLTRKSARLAPNDFWVDLSRLSAGDRRALKPLIEAAYVIDRIYLRQLWSGNLALWERLRRDRTPLGRARLAYFWANKGPWSDLDDHAAFLPGVPARKPLGANFYPEDMSREEFEAWVGKKDASGFFSVVRREGRQLRNVPYREEYRAELTELARLLREAAALTANDSLKKFLSLRADAFLTDDYSASDSAWLDLNSPIDVTIGPYETYTDELFGYKAAFEAYVSLRDEDASAKLKLFSSHLQEIEDRLPLEAKYRNPKIGAAAPIVVVNQLVAGGDAAHGVMTAAYNLPNDEVIVKARGTKQTLMKNVQEAKFQRVLTPIARQVLRTEDQRDLSFEWFFTHILAHELSHGIGPHDQVRQSLKELYSAIEEAKADVTGLFLLQYFFDRGWLPRAEKPLYTTFLASAFRSLRFGIQEAHGRGMALQMSYLMEKGAFRAEPDGRFTVDSGKMAGAVRELAGEILTMEARGDYAAAKAMLDRYAVIRPEVKKALDGLGHIPVDIAPRYVTAERIARPR
jgi:hypothetical protein